MFFFSVNRRRLSARFRVHLALLVVLDADTFDELQVVMNEKDVLSLERRKQRSRDWPDA